MAGNAQAGRLLSITTHLGEGAFVLHRLSVVEALGQPFQIEAEVLATETDIEAKDMIGRPVTCSIHPEHEAEPRHFRGTIRSFGKSGSVGHLDSSGGSTAYRLQAVPDLWMLSRTSDCRIFQNKSVKDIVQTLLDEGSVAPASTDDLPTAARPYCTQFNETDFDFLHRLLDETGCSYYFKFEESQTSLVFTGATATFPAIAGEMIRSNNPTVADAVTGWHSATMMQPGMQAADDFDNLQPKSLLQTTAQTTLQHSQTDASSWELYHWPGTQAFQPEADPATLGMERHEARSTIRYGNTANPQLFAGCQVKIKPSQDEAAKTWLVTSIRHDAFDNTAISNVETAAHGYSNSVSLLPSALAWRNPHRHPRPVIPGLQSALVTGAEGEEIDVDENGRILVHFHWDRGWRKSKQGPSSCRVRVIQPFAGAWGGAWFLPRIGDEVLVAFLDGDPDRPLCVGSVYNAHGKPPFPLPANKTQSGIRTRSSKEGTKDTANIIRLDDKKDSEEVLIHAERDMNVEVERQLQTTVGGDEIRDVVGDHKDQNTGNRTTTIKGDETLTVKEGNRTTTIKQGDDTYELSTGNLSTTIKTGNDTYKLSTGNLSQTLDKGNYDLKLSMGNMSTKLAMGNFGLKLDLGAVTIEAMQGITLKVGASEVKVDQTGVSIKGMMVKLEGTVMLEAKGLMTTVKGDAMTQVSGAIIMIG